MGCNFEVVSLQAKRQRGVKSCSENGKMTELICEERRNTELSPPLPFWNHSNEERKSLSLIQWSLFRYCYNSSL